jgi:hypothetical protein
MMDEVVGNSFMLDQFLGLFFLISRYLHIVAASMLLGGTLFYELIVPIAIDDLKNEQKLLVFARARWAFRWVVWCCVIVLLLSGAISSYRNWYAYTGIEAAITDPLHHSLSAADGLEGAGKVWLSHGVMSLVGLCIALMLVKGPTPPSHPLAWMRINLLVVLIAVFLGSATRHYRLRDIESRLPPAGSSVAPPVAPPVAPSSLEPATGG